MTHVIGGGASGRFVRVTLAVSVALHVAAGAGLLAFSSWKISKLNPPAQEIVFHASPVLHPPEDAPPAPPAHVAAPTPAVPTQPRRPTPEPHPVAAVTLAAAVTDGSSAAADGTGGPLGSPGATGTGGPALGELGIGPGDPIGIPEPPPPPPLENVPQAAIEGGRIAGRRDIPLPDAALALLRAEGKSRVHLTTRLCIDESGAPASVRVTSSSGYPQVDDAVRAEMLRWRYRPWLVNGQPMRVCFPVTFNYRITP